jgi:CBS domain-containing protein
MPSSRSSRRCRDAVKILEEHGIGAAAITDTDQHVLGILSERDIVRTLARNVRAGGACRLCDESVGQVMTREVRTCTQSDTVHEIMERMTAGKFRVVERGRLVGIVSIGDVVNYRLQEMERESNALHEYILTA